MGKLLGKTARRSHGSDPQGETLVASPLERTKRTLPNLQPKDHQDHGLAQPPHSLAITRGIRCSRKPRASPPLYWLLSTSVREKALWAFIARLFLPVSWESA